MRGGNDKANNEYSKKNSNFHTRILSGDEEGQLADERRDHKVYLDCYWGFFSRGRVPGGVRLCLYLAFAEFYFKLEAG